MSDETLDVLIGVYLIPDLAKEDFDAFVELVEEKTITADGVVLVTKDADGRGDGAGDGRPPRTARAPPPAAGWVSCSASSRRRCSPRPRSAPAWVRSQGSFARKRLEAGIGEKMDDALPPGSAGIIADLRPRRRRGSRRGTARTRSASR